MVEDEWQISQSQKESMENLPSGLNCQTLAELEAIVRMYL